MLELRGDPDLALEPDQIVVVVRQHLLDGDIASERVVGGRDDATHAASSELVADREPLVRAVERGEAKMLAALRG